MDRRTLDFSVTPTRAVSRIKRIGDIASRYTTNIASTPRFAKDIYKGQGVGAARERQYSQRTYMGNNGG